ncbi:zinc finger and SCAN domain-containing protein 23-like [Sceloporus undulatus]|uniref:zinc finger and SCAN domain-containing protein 23-like n=1 Tax=Sceloporus undulatus TaxID=8520 RepID=UPI001C4B53EF|nr:zinc finger and SCAN domain-containing protein 23-like [Sceloporus undulatus]
MKMEAEEPRSTGEALESTRKPPHIHLDTTGFNPNMDSDAMGCDEVGIPLSRITPTQVKEEPQKGFMAKHWESQWQTFLKTVESPQSQWLSPPLSIETTPWDDAQAFLISFEQVAKACRWPKEEWAAQLLPAFSGDAEQAFLDLEIRNREDYGSVKEAILRRDAMIQEKHRQNFRGFCYPEAKGLKDGYRQLHELCHQWLKVEKHSKEEILELLVLEQFLTILPLEMQKWVMEHYPESCPQAVALAEGFLQKQQEAEKEEEQVPQAVAAAVISSEANWTVMGEQKQLSTRIKEETNDEQTNLFGKMQCEIVCA